MARVTRWTLFWRVFFFSLIFGSSAHAIEQDEIDAWNAAIGTHTPEAYYLYLSLFPAGEYVDEAVLALIELGAVGSRGFSGFPNGEGSGGNNQPPPEGIYQ